MAVYVPYKVITCDIHSGNKPHPSVAHKQQHHFSEDDPRAQLAMTSVDPRVHFALVCGAKVRDSWLGL